MVYFKTFSSKSISSISMECAFKDGWCNNKIKQKLQMIIYKSAQSDAIMNMMKNI